MRPLTAVDWLFFILLVIGGINWGLVGLLGLDLVALLFGPMTLISRIVYILVGVAAVYILLAGMSRPNKTV
jgi:uncharacterized protein